MTAPSAPSAEDTPPPFAKRRQVEHAERAVRSVHVSVLKPNPTVEVTKHPLTASPTVLTVPAHAFASTASASPAAPVASAPPPAPTDGAGQDVNQQVAPDESESRVSQSTTPAKKGFWHRLNVFKRKNADAKEKQ